MDADRKHSAWLSDFAAANCRNAPTPRYDTLRALMLSERAKLEQELCVDLIQRSGELKFVVLLGRAAGTDERRGQLEGQHCGEKCWPPPLPPTLSASLSHLRKPLTEVPWLAAAHGSGPGLPLPGLLTRCRQCSLPAAWAKSQLQSAALAPGALRAVSAQQAGPRRRRPPSSGGRPGEQTAPLMRKCFCAFASGELGDCG